MYFSYHYFLKKMYCTACFLAYARGSSSRFARNRIHAIRICKDVLYFLVKFGRKFVADRKYEQQTCSRRRKAAIKE